MEEVEQAQPLDTVRDLVVRLGEQNELLKSERDIMRTLVEQNVALREHPYFLLEASPSFEFDVDSGKIRFGFGCFKRTIYRAAQWRGSGVELVYARFHVREHTLYARKEDGATQACLTVAFRDHFDVDFEFDQGLAYNGAQPPLALNLLRAAHEILQDVVWGRDQAYANVEPAPGTASAVLRQWYQGAKAELKSVIRNT